MQKLSDIVVTRVARAEDIPFILSTWKNGVYFAQFPNVKTQDSKVMQRLKDLMVFIASRPNALVKVACHADDPDTLFGYSVQEGDILHWVYVKKAHRGFGIAKSLITQPLARVTARLRITADDHNPLVELTYSLKGPHERDRF